MEDGCADFTCKCPPSVYPSPPPKSIRDAGVKCCQIPPSTCRKAFSLPQKQDYVLDCKQPITIDWPPDKPDDNGGGDCEEDTGPRPDLLAMIPDQIVPQTVTLLAQPSYSPMMKHEVLNHPVCPDAQLHVRIDPTQNKPPELRMPDVPCPVRGPPDRPWIQCVENTLITDQVRRPLARYCHRRPLPPLVIPITKVEEMKAKATEMERKRAAAQKWHQERECQRLKARQRQSKWNYTVESLLERKKRQEMEKEAAEKETTRQLMDEVAKEKKANSDEQIARANKLMLYRKGLIRDFHSALAYSKMMQEIESAKTQSQGQDESGIPQFYQKCTRKMMQPNYSRPDYQSQPKKETPINPKLLESLKRAEARQKEQEQEMNNELLGMKQMLVENAPELPASYKKYISDPVCDDDKKEKDREKYRCELYESIGDKLASDAYIESYEKEIDRQACEFIEYKRQVDAIKKAKEKQLIDEKVAYNQRKSEAAAKVLVQMQQQKKERANEYDALRDKWDEEWTAKIEAEKKAKELWMEKVVADFNKRKCAEGWKRCELDPARQWARERLVEKENFERDCEEKTERRRKAEDICLFNKAQASHKNCTDNRKKYMDNVWAEKMKQDYLNEMKEMKSYAQECIQDWKGKGRNPFPMVHAMKKWDYDCGMYPYLFPENAMDRQQNQTLAQSAKNLNRPNYETTASRLGFGAGGC